MKMNESEASATTSDMDIDELAKVTAVAPTEIALALVVLARALSPRNRTEKAAFVRKIRRSISRSGADQMILRTILNNVIR